MYDLVLKGGWVIDPAAGVDDRLDVAVSADRIAAVGPDLDGGQAGRWIDVTGKIVTPGLIDVHAHVYQHGARNGLDPDLAGVRSGVTTVVDAGSAGSSTYGGFHHNVVRTAATTVLAHVHIARTGLAHVPEAMSLADVDVDATVATVEAHPEVIGVKVRACGPAVESAGLDYIALAVAAARRAGVPLMVHIGDANFGRSGGITRELLPLLEAGDIVTHLYTGAPGRGIDDQGVVLPELVEARERGVRFDAAHGRYNFSFDVARRMLDQGVLTDTISTDVTRPGRSGVVGSMTHMMGKFLALGLDLAEVVALCTVNPARLILGDESLGTLAAGTVADIAVLEAEEGEWPYTDGQGTTVHGPVALRPVLTVKTGELFAPDYGPYPAGWFPEA